MRLNAESCANNPNAPELDEDSIAIASLLHDICDCSGMRDISGHGKRSAKLLKALEFKLTQEEFLAIRFHMSLKDKKSHPLYYDALKSQLRYVVHEADGISARLHKGYEEHCKKQADLDSYLQNITKIDCKEIIYQVEGGWFSGIHSPYDGEIDSEWKDKIISIKKYDTAELYAINDHLLELYMYLKQVTKRDSLHCTTTTGCKVVHSSRRTKNHSYIATLRCIVIGIIGMIMAMRLVSRTMVGN